jgi:hypothetical protein
MASAAAVPTTVATTVVKPATIRLFFSERRMRSLPASLAYQSR